MNHKEILGLLPWYVSGTLGPDDRRAVEEELASCHECAAHAEELTGMRGAIVGCNEQFPEPSPFLLSRALSRVDEHERYRATEKEVLTGWWRRQIPVVASIILAVPLIVIAAVAAVIGARSFYAQDVASTNGVQPVSVEYLNSSLPRPAEPSRVAQSIAAPSGAQATHDVIAPLAPPSRTQNQIARTGQISLFVRDVEPSVRSLYQIARQAGGDVVGLQDDVPSDPSARHTAEATLSVPVTRFDSTMQTLAGLGKLTSETVQAENETGSIVDYRARLENARRTEADIRQIMDRSGSIEQVLAAESQLSSARQDIEQLSAELNNAEHAVADSTISVDLSTEAAAAGGQPSFRSQLADAWAAARRAVTAVSVGLASIVLWLLAFAPYIVLVGLIGGFIWLAYRRRGVTA